jgi:hypothetical protein
VSERQPSIGFATPADVPELARLRWELYAEQEGGVAEAPESYRERFARFAVEALASEEWRAWVARADDRLVGAMWLRKVPRVPVPGKRAGPIGYLTTSTSRPSIGTPGWADGCWTSSRSGAGTRAIPS